MANILTPAALWGNFNADLDVLPVTLGERTEDGVKYDTVKFSGRDTGMGRVSVFGVLASDEKNPSERCILVLCDSKDKVDEKLLCYLVKNGYSALCVDYAGIKEDTDRFTEYPANVEYANLSKCGRHKDYADDSADKTCWYEWVAVGIYAHKYLSEKFHTENIGLLGIADGGEIAWKLAYAAKFSCLVTVNACGWLAYKGFAKFEGKEPQFDDERYRFVAGIDSQSYAPYVKCPVLILCSACNPDFDCDRAYDTFSRINPEYATKSFISYSVNSGSQINYGATSDMFKFFAINLNGNERFIPRPAKISVSSDEEQNLVCRVICDNSLLVEKCEVFFATDNYDYVTREWCPAPLKKVINANESEHFLNVYEKASLLFVVCNVTYSGGFTVWSKIAVKKISGKFRNSRAKSKIIYNNKFGAECFVVNDDATNAVSGVFLPDNEAFPALIEMNGLSGVYSKYGLKTNRIKSAQFLPSQDSILKFDITAENNEVVEVMLKSRTDGNIYSVKLNVVGGVWQSQMLSAKMLKNQNGVSLVSYTQCDTLIIVCSGKYALNNLIWL